MKKEIPLEQRKGVFKRCKTCNGYGRVEVVQDWSTSMYFPHVKPTRVWLRCKVCDGTGQITWIERITKI